MIIDHFGIFSIEKFFFHFFEIIFDPEYFNLFGIVKIVNRENIGNLGRESVSIEEIGSSEHIVFEIHIRGSDDVWIFYRLDLVIVISFPVFDDRNIS